MGAVGRNPMEGSPAHAGIDLEVRRDVAASEGFPRTRGDRPIKIIEMNPS